ncbi:MCE family protein [Actinokineospora fastidiosa]|uniref:ABC transporter substrate-binding protein n=1 Tax=Actinokineospora fastidiosa TaxID=1816 RepID=A0A918GNW3_9PSEU|nr:MCE family protein [Actinokineospora fastidiosa]GGS48156.1 ABC transporter substrate-binding protein [Actinokineospora fastidiosa]
MAEKTRKMGKATKVARPPRVRKPRKANPWIARGALLAVVAIVVAAGTWAIAGRGDVRRLTAYFTAAVGLYPGSDVRVLGVQVGTVDSVTPQGASVRVEMTVDAEAPIPADANALVVTPSLVSDRYVQLSPVWTAGDKIADGAVIPVPRTQVPVELDELFASLDRLTTALGPDGANADGALSELLRTGAEYLGGNGAATGQTIRDLGDLARTLNGSQEDLFATIDGLHKFTAMLAKNDEQVREVNEQLAIVTEFLVNERTTFDQALSELASALETVEVFIRDNRALLKSNVEKLTGVTQVLVDQRASLAEALDTVPNALTNLLGAYDPATRTIDGRANLTEFSASAPRAFPLPATDDPGGR